MKYMANDYSDAPQGATGSGGLGGTSSSGQGAGSWSVQPQYPQYEPQRAFAVAAAPGQSDNPSRAAGQDMASGQGNAPGLNSANSANGANASGLGVLIIRPLPSEEGGQTREIVLTGRDVAIGRSPACDVVLEGDQLVSRRHALLRYNGTQYTVVDLGSSNGTYVNEVEIHGNTPLRDGDLITIGEHEVLYSARPAANAGATQAMPAVGQGTGFGATTAPAPGSFQEIEPAPWSAQPTGESAPHLTPGSLQASQLFDIAAAQTLLEPHPNAQGRPEPVWTQPAQQASQAQPSAAQPVQPPAVPQVPSAQQQPQPIVPPIQAQAPAYPQQPSPYEQLPAQSNAYPYPQQPSGAPTTSSASTPNQPQSVAQGVSPGGLSGGPFVPPSFVPPSFVPPSTGGSTSSIRNTSASLRAVRAQLDEANQRLAQAEEEESRLAEQRHAALVEVRDRLNAILGEQGRNANVGYGPGMYGTAASPNANPNLNSLISLARQTAENPRHIDYMMQLAAHAGEIASALENAQNPPSSRGGDTALLVQLDGLRARLDELIS